MSSITTPEHILDIGAFERGVVFDATLLALDNGEVPSLYGDDAVLGEVLANPFAFQNVTVTEAASGATAVWRLGAARKASGAVLRHVVDVTTLDDTFIENSATIDTVSVAADLLKADPELLRTTSPSEASAFWRLVGYNPDEPVDGVDESLVAALQAIQHATYIPEVLFTRVEEIWGHTHVMEHPPEFKVGDEDGSVEMEQPTEREGELDEAFIRVMCSAFLAERRDTPADWTRLSASIEDYVWRGSIDVDGFEASMKMTFMLNAVGLCQEGLGLIAIEPVRNQMEAYADQVRLGDLPLETVLILADDAHDLVTLDDTLTGLQGLVDRALPQIESVIAFNSAVVDPQLSVEPGEHISAQRMLEMTNAATSRVEVAILLQKLRGETFAGSARTPEDIEREMTAGLTQELLLEAFSMACAELDPSRKAALCRQFNAALAWGLRAAEEDEGSPYSAADSLLKMHDGSPHMGLLAYFPAGSQFLDRKLHEFADEVTHRLASPELLLDQPGSALMAANWSEAVHNALWYNRTLYLEDRWSGVAALTAAQQTLVAAYEYIKTATRDALPHVRIGEQAKTMQQFGEILQAGPVTPDPTPRAPLPGALRRFVATPQV